MEYEMLCESDEEREILARDADGSFKHFLNVRKEGYEKRARGEVEERRTIKPLPSSPYVGPNGELWTMGLPRPKPDGGERD